ncbi:hypothetical protein DFH06DRAFT_1132207 [Mycena polygramma]|nr:hypothetical protein DFH06DRAFT_1132207 [Mycena polygramma]
MTHTLHLAMVSVHKTKSSGWVEPAVWVARGGREFSAIAEKQVELHNIQVKIRTRAQGRDMVLYKPPQPALLVPVLPSLRSDLQKGERWAAAAATGYWDAYLHNYLKRESWSKSNWDVSMPWWMSLQYDIGCRCASRVNTIARHCIPSSWGEQVEQLWPMEWWPRVKAKL